MPTDLTRLNILIVDDEKKACTNLTNLLVAYVDPTINISGVAYNTIEAEARIAELAPDAVFLDIEMPNENAFHFLERMSPFNFEVVFVTAYDEYAIKAFKLNAVDYILKPISIDELRNAVKKLKERITYKTMIAAKPALYSEISNQVNNKLKQNKITLKDNTAIEVVDFKDIYFVEANGSYSRIVFLKNNDIKEMMMSSPLSDYEELLPDDLFYRIHRSYLVNCSQLKKIPNDGSNSVIINNDITLPVSRRRYAPLIEFLITHHSYNE